MSRFPYAQYPQPPNDSEISPIKNAIPAHIPGIPDDQLVSFNDLKVGYYYYFSFLEHTGDEDDDEEDEEPVFTNWFLTGFEKCSGWVNGELFNVSHSRKWRSPLNLKNERFKVLSSPSLKTTV